MKIFFIVFFTSLTTIEAVGQINVQNFYPSSDNSTFTLLRSNYRTNDRFNLRFVFEHVENPLSVVNSNGQETSNLIERVSSFYVTPKLHFFPNFDIGANLPLHLYEDSQTSNRFLIGDSRLWGAFHLGWEGSLLLVPEIFLPGGNSEFFLSSDSLGYGLQIAKSFVWRELEFIINLGIRHFSSSEFQNLDYTLQSPVGGGVIVPISESVRLSAEIKKNFLLKGDEENSPGYFLLGFSFDFEKKNSLFIAGGTRNYNYSQPEKFEGVTAFDLQWSNKGEKVCTFKETNEYRIRPLTKEELSSLKGLPYISTDQQRISLLNLGEMTARVDGNPTVSNSQVVFAFDYERAKDSKIVGGALNLELTKISEENSTSTEVLCLLNFGICSGELFTHSGWLENINKYFFKTGSVANDYFSHQFLTKVVGKSGKKKIFSSEVVLDLEELIRKNSKHSTLDELFTNRKDNSIFIVVADDTFVSVRGSVVLQEEKLCK